VTASDCEGGECTWTVVTHNLTTDTQVSKEFEDTEDFWAAVGGAVEVYGLYYCSHYPYPGVFLKEISLKDENETSVTPSWATHVEIYADPFCNLSVDTTSTTVDLYHFPDLAANLTGPEEAPPDEECAWQAWAFGGLAPFSYDWWGALTGSTQTIFGSLSSSSYLWVEITDSRSVADTAQIFIDVDEEYECDWKQELW